jgi:hypothetical protein
VMHLGLSADEASRLTWHNPRAAMGLIAPTPGPRRD